MTRPHMIRADTIDLQDKTAPTAQDHSQQPQRPAPLGIGPAAPHQQAAIRHVEQERSSEEARLHDAWGHAGDTLQSDPGSDDERTTINHNHTPHNGSMADDAHAEADVDVDEDMDDDDMDKISSSPSISDGGYSLPYCPPTWPARKASLTPHASPIQSEFLSSSPFTTAPIHFPMSPSVSLGPFSVPADSLSFSSPFPSSSTNANSMEHHLGEYAGNGTTTTTTNPISAVSASEFEATTQAEFALSPRSKRLTNLEHRLPITRDESLASLTPDINELAVTMARPLCRPSSTWNDDPFIESTASPPRTANGTPPPATFKHYDDDDGEDSWTTDSDADSWDEDPENNDDASNEIFFSDDSRFIDSGWGGECLRETEEIDFEFVYALHTFVATVEGQANATKGDTMVLLDDSNSYWWLVRIVKDGSIGYLPAEHIETPTERLARLNKHRNIDLSATMLGDTAEKTKNPLKKARRRRNAKTVQFGLPTYVEASDYDYSSDEGEGELFGGPEPKQMQQQQQQASQNADTVSEEGLQVQPLNVNGPRKDANGQPEGEIGNPGDSAKRDDDKSTTSEGNVDRPLDAKVSRNGTLRNTDSFFNDENTETRKITLTPNLLRDDSSTSTTGSRERGPSLESLEKNGFADKVRKDDKKKEKKPGMLSGLFKRKDKKTKGSLDSVEGDLEKPDETGRVSPQSKSAEESQEQPSTADQATAPTTTLLRQPSKGKLQKSQRNRDDSPQKTKSILKTDSPVQSPLQSETVVDATDGDRANRQTASTMRMVSNGKDESRPTVTEPTTSPEGRTAMKVVNSLNPFPSKTQLNGEPKPEEVKKSKQRVQLDDFDSSSDESNDPFADPDAQTGSSQVPGTENADSLSESPVHVSAVDAQPPQHNPTQEQPRETNPHKPPALTADTSSQETSSPVSTPDNDSPMKTIPEHRSLSTFQTHSGSSPATQSPQSAPPPPPSRLAPTPVRDMDREPSPPVSSSSSVLPAWSDTSLRAYLDDSSEVRDLLLLVHDTTGVVPVSRDHPLMKDLFVQESRTMQSLSSELDALLKGVMDKRMVGSGVAKGGKTGSSSSIGTVRSRSASGGLRTGR